MVNHSACINYRLDPLGMAVLTPDRGQRPRLHRTLCDSIVAGTKKPGAVESAGLEENGMS